MKGRRGGPRGDTPGAQVSQGGAEEAQEEGQEAQEGARGDKRGGPTRVEPLVVDGLRAVELGETRWNMLRLDLHGSARGPLAARARSVSASRASTELSSSWAAGAGAEVCALVPGATEVVAVVDGAAPGSAGPLEGRDDAV